MTKERLSQLSLEDLFHLVEIFDVDLSEIEEHDRAELEQALFDTIDERRRDREESNTFPISYHEQRFDNLDELFGRLTSPNEWGFEFPTSYNVTRIELMLRDPSWAYCYWDISLLEKQRLLKDADFQHFELHLENLDPEAVDALAMVVPVQLTDASWYLNIQERETSYRVSLVAIFDGREQILASSQKIQVPRGDFAPQFAVLDSVETDALIALSGIERLGLSGFSGDVPQRILNIKDSWEA